MNIIVFYLWVFIVHPFFPCSSVSLSHTHVFQKHGPKAQNKITLQSRIPEHAKLWITTQIDDTAPGAFQSELADL